MWSKVTEQHDNIIIVGSSPEALSFIPHPDWTVIAVNGAIHITKQHTDYWFTLDPSQDNRAIMVNQAQLWGKFYVAVPPTYGTPQAPTPFLTKKPPRNVHYLLRVQDNQRRLSQKYGLSNDPSEIHTGNSAYGALGLAYHMKPKNIILLGVNGDAGKRYDGSQSIGSLSHVPKLFASAAPQLDQAGTQVYNGNMVSQVDCFAKFDYVKEGYEGFYRAVASRAGTTG